MKLMERIGNFISGGKLKLYRDHRDRCIERMYDLESEVTRLKSAMLHIQAYTATQKSGTAQKVARMCEGVLK